jgi:hypothetical protein
LKNKDKYEIIYPLKNSFWLELKDGYGTNTAVTTLIESMLEEVIIVNNSYNIWRPNEGSIRYHGISVNKDIFDLYFSTLINKLVEQTDNSEPDKIKKQYEQQIFGTSDENRIKLQLYRTCKNIHDKWLAGVQDDNIIFQCGKRNSVDTKLTQKTNDENVTTTLDLPKLIDSFRFVSRSFRDIGDDLYINPLPVKDFLVDNQNSSSYDAISSILNNNNFEFIALPSFINFKDDDELESVFKPFGNYGEAISETSCGPSFVCVYIGQKSIHLDYSNSDYPNDGFDLRCIDGNVDPNVPDDFKINSEEFEDPVAAFVVKYGQQNQNLFKDITLDQSEFTETDESLQIQEDISQKGSESNRTIGGQNIYNVYAVRSYKAEIEMMGNAMIQPMMYFQLDNIPMFHGAYMITRVKHNIKPNYMSTNFTGVRIRHAQTKLLDSLDLYMSFIDTLDLSTSKPLTDSSTASSTKSIVTSYKLDLNNNLPKEKTIVGVLTDNEKNLIKVRAEEEISNWRNGRLDESNGVQYLDKYADATPGFTGEQYGNNKQPWSAIFISYIALAGDKNFPKSTAHHEYIKKAMEGKFGYEVFPLKSGLKIKAEIGDIINSKRKGGYYASHSRIVFKVEGNLAYTIGGNESDSIGIKEYNIIDGYFTDETNFGTYELLMKKTNNFYYNNKKLIGTINNLKTPPNNKTQIDAKLIYFELKKQFSYTDEAIAGIMGNMYQESRFIATSTNSSDGGYGLIQWTNNRKTKLFEYMKNNKIDVTLYVNQIKFLKHELEGEFKFTGKKIKDIKSVDESTKVFYVTYEGGNLGTLNFTDNAVNKRLNELNSVDNSFPKRKSFANQFYNMIKKNSFYLPK